jgi:tRNA modification GTPase
MEEPIIAIATGNVNSAIGIIRCSGEGVLEQINSILHKSISESDDHRMLFRRIIINGEELDQGMVAYFKAPHSYTGEDSVELYLHGNIFNLQRIIEKIIQTTGIRLAEPGEFTRRAFLNGKMDLTQAEAVAEFISAQSERAIQSSLRHLDGDIREFLREVRNKFIHVMSLLEIELDFAEEELEFVDRSDIQKEILQIRTQLQKALTTFQYGQKINQGIRVVITGKPNVGKSSLLNAILGKERAIVSEIPGTTRDFIEASMHLEGFLIHLIDTAGIRKAGEKIEKIGINYTKKVLEEADILLMLTDPTQGWKQEDQEIIEMIQPESISKTLMIINKIDLLEQKELDQFIQILNQKLPSGMETMKISAIQKTHIEKLLKRIIEKIIQISKPAEDALIITSLRQATLIEKTIKELDGVLQAIERQMPSEMLSFDLRTAMETIGEITGEITTDEILNHVFSSFCIGK